MVRGKRSLLALRENDNQRLNLKLLHLLCVEDRHIEIEREVVKNATSSFPSVSIEQFRRLLDHAAMKDLMHSVRCTMIHIATVSSEYSTESYSPMSVVSLALVESLLHHEAVHVIHFFSGAHSDSSDSLRGVHGMLRSLVFQTLSKFQYDLEDIITPQLDDEVRRESFSGLCRLLRELILQLPPDVIVFCVVDQVQLCQIDDSEEELLEEFVDTLGSLTEMLLLHAVLKVVMVSSGHCPIGTTRSLETIMLSGNLAQGEGNISLGFMRERIQGVEED